MIVRVLPDNSVVKIDVPPEQEDVFLTLNPNQGFMKVDSLPESVYGYYKYLPDTNEIVVDEEKELEQFKQDLIQQLKDELQNHILENYPIEKQQADEQQKDYYGTALLMVRTQINTDLPKLTVDQIYLEVGDKANQILDGISTLEIALQDYPENERYYWEQLIKGACRKAWTVRCVNIFNRIREEILSKSSLTELENYAVQIFDFPEFPNF